MKVRSLYHKDYEIRFRNQDTRSVGRAFVVPGQGSAYPGMFRDFLEGNEEFRTLFLFADEASGNFDLLPVSSYITAPHILPQEKLHVYRNCALFTAEVAMGRTLIRKGVLPDAVTGHSFGECAGLVLSGIFSFEEMFPIVVHRNLLCPPANDLGFMVTLNGTREKLAEFLSLPGVYLANLNSPKQLVVSIAISSRDTALEWLRKNRTPHIILHGLPQPYHSPLMEPYRERLHQCLPALKFSVSSPSVPFFSGILHDWITEANVHRVDFTDLLARQLTEPVNFIQQIEALRDKGCRRFYEVGPGKMLEPPMKTILGKDLLVYRNVEALLPKDLDQRLLARPQNEALKKSRWFERIKEVLQSVTGYKTDDIDIAHSFQNDLGIDSIKKAEILVRIIKDENLNASSDFSVTRFSTIYEAVEYLENYSSEEDPLKTTHTEVLSTIIPNWQRTGILRINALVDNGLPLFRLPWNEKFLSSLHFSTPSLVVLECPAGSAPAKDFPCRFLPLYREFLKTGGGQFHLAILDRTHDEAYFPVASFFRSLVKEGAPFSVGWIHDPEALVTEDDLRAELSVSHIRDVRYTGGERFVKNFTPFSVPPPRKRDPISVLALGGSRGINFEILRRFPVEAGDRLVLVGRTRRTDSSLEVPLKILADHWKNFTYVEADLESSERSVKALKKEVKNEISVLLNAAGKEVSQAYETRNSDEIATELTSKLRPLETIAEIRRIFTIRKVLNFSSIVSQFGNKGQAAYAWGNAFVERADDPHTTALAWGPWENVGMTTNLGVLQRIREWGISLISPVEGARIAAQLMLSDVELPPVIIPMDLKDVFLLSAEQSRAPILGKLTDNFEAVFQNNISISDSPFLEDHIILGKRVLPVAWLLSQLLAYGRSMYSRQVAVTDFEVHNLLFLEDDKFSYKLQIFSREEGEVSVWSYLKNASGKILPGEVFAPFVMPSRSGEKMIDLNTFYDTETFGPRFQFMKHAFVDPGGKVRVEAKMEENPVLSKNLSFDFWLFLIDLALQSISLQVKTVTGGVTMPVKFECLVFTSGDVIIAKSVFIYPEIHHQTDREGLATVVLTNERNEAFCRIENVFVRKHFLRNRLEVKVLST